MIAPTKYPLKFLAAILPVSIIGGFLAFNAPLLGLGLATSAAVIAVGMSREGFLTRGFILFLAIALVGYAFFGRAFAYLGVAPLYVGELVMTVGLMSALLFRSRFTTFGSSVGWAILAFMLWGVICTVPYLTIYGIDALRDGVVWGYGIFAILLAPLVLHYRAGDYIFSLYARLLTNRTGHERSDPSFKTGRCGGSCRRYWCLPPPRAL
jgi:hypothetical protein